jgi:hypothetical protein
MENAFDPHCEHCDLPMDAIIVIEADSLQAGVNAYLCPKCKRMRSQITPPQHLTGDHSAEQNSKPSRRNKE